MAIGLQSSWMCFSTILALCRKAGLAFTHETHYQLRASVGDDGSAAQEARRSSRQKLGQAAEGAAKAPQTHRRCAMNCDPIVWHLEGGVLLQNLRGPLAGWCSFYRGTLVPEVFDYASDAAWGAVAAETGLVRQWQSRWWEQPWQYRN